MEYQRWGIMTHSETPLYSQPTMTVWALAPRQVISSFRMAVLDWPKVLPRTELAEYRSTKVWTSSANMKPPGVTWSGKA